MANISTKRDNKENFQKSLSYSFIDRIIEGINDILTKLLIFILFLFVIFVFKDHIIGLMRNYPIIYMIYTHIKFNIINNTLPGLFYYCFFTSLFFIFIPIEVIFLFYSNLNHNIFLVTIIALTGNILALQFNYIFGRVIGTKILAKIMGNQFHSFHRGIQKWGGAIVLIGNIIIFPIEIASVVFGAAKYDFKKFVWYSIIGKIIKFWILLMGRDFFVSQIMPWLNALF